MTKTVDLNHEGKTWNELQPGPPVLCKTCGQEVAYSSSRTHVTYDVTTKSDSQRKFVITRCLVEL